MTWTRSTWPPRRAKTAKEILAAAQPLTGQADQIIQATTSIDASAKSIDTTVGQIGDAVKGIDGSARSINGNVLEINKTVKDINGTAKAISGTVNGIDGNVAGIGSTVKGIGGNLAAVLGVAQEIRGDHAAAGIGPGAGGIAAINRRADVIIGAVQAIKGDTGNILATVLNIEKSAKSIEGKATRSRAWCRGEARLTRGGASAWQPSGAARPAPQPFGGRTRKEPITSSKRGASAWKSSFGRAWNTKLIIVEPLNRK